MFNQLKKGIKQIKMKDLFSPLLFLIVILPSQFLRLMNNFRHRQIWLVTEREDTASDNAYWFFYYLKTAHPEVNSWYVIDKNCEEYKNVKDFGNIIQYGSLKHWIYYLASEKKISSQKASNPAPALFYVIHVYLRLFNNRIYLKHGIIKDDADWWHYDHTRYSKIICGAKPEYDFIKENFGYPEKNVIYTGLARFDNLYNNCINTKQILIMPTWRNWLGTETNFLSKKTSFEKTDYYKSWNSLLTNRELTDFAEKHNLEILFYPHHNMHKFAKFFDIPSKNIRIVTDVNIQKLLKESALMITDFSSVFMDFAYMQKPIIFYQFDKEEYRKRQYQQGYFDYEKNGFGDVLQETDDVVDAIKKYYNQKFQPESKYLDRMKKFFEYHDQNNCERIYEAIK